LFAGDLRGRCTGARKGQGLGTRARRGHALAAAAAAAAVAGKAAALLLLVLRRHAGLASAGEAVSGRGEAVSGRGEAQG
jgi:hypothetical protein